MRCEAAPETEGNLGLANSMGLFLQKTNIIRDYLEDYVPQLEWTSRRFRGRWASLLAKNSRLETC